MTHSRDGHPQGEPEYVRDLPHERQLGLQIHGQIVPYLGLLAIRCTRRGTTLIPLTLSIAETPIYVVEAVHADT